MSGAPSAGSLPPVTWRCPQCRLLNRPGTAECSCGAAYDAAAQGAWPAAPPVDGMSGDSPSRREGPTLRGIATAGALIGLVVLWYATPFRTWFPSSAPIRLKSNAPPGVPSDAFDASKAAPQRSEVTSTSDESHSPECLNVIADIARLKREQGSAALYPRQDGARAAKELAAAEAFYSEQCRGGSSGDSAAAYEQLKAGQMKDRYPALNAPSRAFSAALAGRDAAANAAACARARSAMEAAQQAASQAGGAAAAEAALLLQRSADAEKFYNDNCRAR